MAVSTSRSGGIYITVSGDYSQFEKDMRKIRAMANTTATDISRAMSGAMSSTSATKNITKLSSSFQQAQRSAKAMTADMSRLDQKFKEIGQTIGVTQRDLGKFSAIQQRAFQHQGSQVFEKSLKDIQRLIGQANEEIHLLTRTLGGTGQGFSTTAAAAQSLGNTLATVKGAAIAAAVAFATGALVTYADSYTNLQNTLKIVTGDQAEFTSMMAGVLTVANASATSIGETTTNFYRLHNALKDLGATKEEVLRLTETLQKLSIHISGGSTEQAAIAMQQFTMSLTSGTVSAREYRSTISTMPMLLNALMKAAGKATEEELDEAVKKGQVTSMHLFTALASIPKQIDTLYATLGTTMGQALTVFGNNITATVGAIDDAFGVSAGVAKGMESLSEKIRNSSGELITFISCIDNAAVALGTYVLVSWKGAAALAAIKIGATGALGALALNVAAFRMLTATCGVASAALTVATMAAVRMALAVKALTVAMLTNPLGWVAAIAYGIYSLVEGIQEAGKESERLRDIYRGVEESIEGSSKAAKNLQEITASSRATKADNASVAAQDAYQKKMAELKAYTEDFHHGLNLNFGTLESRLEGNTFAFSAVSDAARKASIFIADFYGEMEQAGKDTEAQSNVLVQKARELRELEAAYPNAEPLIKARAGFEALGGASIAAYKAIGEKEAAEAALKAIYASGIEAAGAMKELDELMAKIREQPAMPTDAASAYDWLVKWTQGADDAKEAQWALEVSTARMAYSLLAQTAVFALVNKRLEDFKTLSGQLSERKVQMEEKIALGPDGGKGAEGAKQHALEMQVAKTKELDELMAKIRGQSAMPKDSASAYEALVKWTQSADVAKEKQWELEKSTAANTIAMLEQTLAAMRLQAAMLAIGAIGNIDVRVRMDLITVDANRLAAEIEDQKYLIIKRVALGPDGGKGSGGGGGGGGGVDEGKEYARQTSKKIADVEQEILYLQKEQAGVSQEQIELLKMKYAHTKSLNELEEQADKAKMLGSAEYKDMVRLTTQLHTMKLRVVEYEAAWAPVTSQLQHAIDLANALGESTDKATLALKQQQLFMAQLPTSPGYGTLANDRQIELLNAQVENLRDNLYGTFNIERKELGRAIDSLNQGLAEGVIAAQQYEQKMLEIGLRLAEIRQTVSESSFADDVNLALAHVTDGFENVTKSMTESFGNFFQSLSQGFADSIGQAITQSEDLGSALHSVAKQGVSSLISSLVQLGIQWALTQFLGQSISKSAQASAAAQGLVTGEALQAAYTPAAMAASIATFGGAVAVGSAAMFGAMTLANTMSLAGGFKGGGYTGNISRDQIAGAVHGQEYVFDAKATSRLGVGFLDDLRGSAHAGAAASAINSASASGFGNASPVVSPVNLNIEVNSQPGIAVEVEPISEGQIRIWAKQEAQTAIQKDVPVTVAKEIRNANSLTSKALATNTKTTRRR